MKQIEKIDTMFLDNASDESRLLARKLNEIIDFLGQKSEQRPCPGCNPPYSLKYHTCGYKPKQEEILKEEIEKSVEKKCCEKCNKRNGYDGIPNVNICGKENCSCHIPVETNWQKEFKEVWSDKGEIYPNRYQRIESFISSLLLTAKAEERERIKGIIENKIKRLDYCLEDEAEINFTLLGAESSCIELLTEIEK